jgi:hypothetical protein
MDKIFEQIKNDVSSLEELKKLNELSKMAFYNSCVEYGCNIPEEYVGKTVPTEESFSKFEIAVWHLMKNTIRDGMILEKSIIVEG